MKTISKISIPQEVMFREIAGESVLVSTTSGIYFGLDKTGTRMWQLLARHGSIEPVVKDLFQEYDAPEERLRQDLLAFVDELVAHQLVKVD